MPNPHRLAALPLAALWILFLLSGISPQEPEHITAKDVRGLHGLVDDVAHLGKADDLALFQETLIELREPPKNWERSTKTWNRNLEKAKHRGNAKRQQRVAADLAKQVRLLGRKLDDLVGGEQERLARLLLKLDGNFAPAHEVLGHTERDGKWLTQQSAEWQEQAGRISELVRAARELPIELVTTKSKNPTLVQVYGEEAICVSGGGMELHGAIEPYRLNRVLRQSLRAMALSQALLGKPLAVPKFTRTQRVVLTREEAGYEAALDEALANGGIDAEQLKTQRTTDMRSFQDHRGWRTSRWRTEADYEALLLWIVDRQWMGWEVQPCLRAGHLNWLCLAFFGTSSPTVRWKEAGAAATGTTSERQQRVDALWKSASRSLFGCKSWMKARMQAGDSFPYTRAILPVFGKIVDEPLLKATLVNEYLQATGQLGRMVQASAGKENRVEAIEEALGKSLPEFEEEWAAWLFDGDGAGAGLVQRVGGSDAGEPTATPAAREFLSALNRVRERAFQSAEFTETVELFEELSRGAELHARYLVINPEQGAAWPDAHEEYPDKEGFSAEGSSAGLRSVIHFTPDPVEALDGWMGTFYHRLPLIEPGLFGVGWGVSGDVSVADCASLVAPYWAEAWVVWPANGARDVPLRFQPELPNPVPGEDQSTWGYPITLQAYWGDTRQENEIELSLHLGDSSAGELVDCHFLTPSEPAFPELAPKDAYCLIPQAHLKSDTEYTVLARCPQTGDSETYRFKTGR